MIKDTPAKLFHSQHPFVLELGAELKNLTIAYHTFGKLNERRDNCIWVCHALTANSNVADWWPGTVEPEAFLDPDKYFVVCANILGSCYGTTGPLSVNPDTGEPWYDSFPHITIRDMVKAHQLLAEHLGIDKIYSLIGSSVGGFQAVEWAVAEPGRFQNVVLIATSAVVSPWAVAIDETQRMAIFADATYGEKRSDAARKGLATARALGLLTYRGSEGYNLTQQDVQSNTIAPPSSRRACTYQQYQGSKLVNRFDAYSYVTILNAFDTHDVSRNRGSLDKVLATLTMPVLCVAITTDILFTPKEILKMANSIPRSRYVELTSDFGHDGFLVEGKLLNKIIKEFFKNCSE